MATPAKATLPLCFWLPLSGSREDALHLVQYKSTTKAILACTQHFSEHDGIHSSRSITDWPSHFIYYLKHIFPNGTRGILASYTLDDDTHFSAMDHVWVVDIVLDALAGIHDCSKEELWALCPYSFVKNWGHDPHSMGGFTFFTPFQLVEYAKDLSQPEGWVYFDGEHMALPQGWIDMAIKSSLRAAKSIHSAAGLVEGQEPGM
ncbi:L-amino-acid oxidase-like [Heterocephalus glaber]|uniref:L-amino-acid oxidase-like n=1 Tax=Heterocephalus glaber TaxID=10181 RepID=A0AAX6QQU1_HETGA|nr:L-amino-acid oxidase-like [Heterocephalus glaber]